MPDVFTAAVAVAFLLFFGCAGMTGHTPVYYAAHVLGFVEALLQQFWISLKAFARNYRDGFRSTLLEVRAGLGAVKTADRKSRVVSNLTL